MKYFSGLTQYISFRQSDSNDIWVTGRVFIWPLYEQTKNPSVKGALIYYVRSLGGMDFAQMRSQCISVTMVSFCLQGVKNLKKQNLRAYYIHTP